MFTHTSPTISLHSMATRLPQIRLSPYFSRSTKKESFNRISSPARPAKRSMYPARQVQRDRMAQPTTKSQQAGARRPHRPSHHQQDSDWTCPGGAHPLPETSRKHHYQDRNKRGDANLMKSLPRKPIQRKPLHNIDANAYNSRFTPRSFRQEEDPACKASTATPQAQYRMSEMYTLIDDHLAWNLSAPDFELARPGSSGTMFVDFGSNGEMEVSYRNGVNKKLPTPPVPPKIPSPSEPTPSRHALEIKKQVQLKTQRKEIEQSKPLPPRPSQSSRHDSAISSGAEHKENIDPFQARPLPQLPSQNSRRAQPQSRKSYPPQVHRTQHSSAQTNSAHHSSLTPSQTSTPSYHTAASTRTGEAYTVIEPSGLTMHYHPGRKPASPGYVSGHDPATQYTYDYDGHTMHVHGSPTPSRPGSRTSEYFDIPASTYKPSHNSSCNPSTSTTCKPTKTKVSGKHLPSLPPSATRAQLPDPPRGGIKKRRKVFTFVQKLLHKLDNLGVMKDLSSHQRHRHPRAAGAKKLWV